MIHDLDANLHSGNLRSFTTYEEEIFQNVVPMIHETFEELDEETVNVLQRFFQAHGLAVRHAVAKTTRRLLKSGQEGGAKYDVDDDKSLQEFALQWLLKQRWGNDDEDGNGTNGGLVVDKIVVGCPQPDYVVEAVKAVDKL